MVSVIENPDSNTNESNIKTEITEDSPPYANGNVNNKITGRLTNGIDPFAIVYEFLLQRYENFFKYCCICLVRKRQKTMSCTSGSGVMENSTIGRYRVEYDPNSTSIIPVISYSLADAIKINGTDASAVSRPVSHTNHFEAANEAGYESEVSSILGETVQDDSDDSTATRIIEKSHLFQNQRPKSGTAERQIEIPVPSAPASPITTEPSSEPQEFESEVTQEPEPHHNEPTLDEQIEEILAPDEVKVILSQERPKTCIVAHENETIVITRPKTTGAIANYERRDFKLTLEIEPVDQITIKTPPKTPDRVSLIFDLHETLSLTQLDVVDAAPAQELLRNLSPQLLPALPAPTTSPIVDIPVSPKLDIRPVTPSSPRSRSATQSPILPFEEIPIAVKKVDVAPIIPHFNTPQAQQGSDSTYESTTDTEQKKPVVNEKPKRKKVKENMSTKKVERPRDMIVNCFLKLQSSHWEEVMEGLEAFVFLMRHHIDLVDANIHLMAIELSKQIRNLRSQVARAACQAATELFQTHRRTIEPVSEELTATLLNRTSDTNKFLRADAIKALETMCESLSVARVIHLLAFKGATHHNGLVKCATAKLLAKLVDRIGGERIFTLSKETRDKLIVTSANLLTEGSLETRSYAKEIFRNLNAGHPNAAKIFVDVIPPRVYRNIEKTLKNMLIF